MVKLLLSFGANLTHVDHRGSSALHYAAYNGHTATVEVLVEAGISPNSVNKFGYSALQYAAADGRAETTSRLVELGADVNQVSSLVPSLGFYGEGDPYVADRVTSETPSPTRGGF